MRKLEETWTKNGYTYKQAWRDSEVCIAEQYCEGNMIAYEVFEVLQLPEAEIMGNKVEAREGIPSSEQWGLKAYTVHTIQMARKKVDILKKKIKDRNAN